jgi:hypothetical protein
MNFDYINNIVFQSLWSQTIMHPRKIIIISIWQKVSNKLLILNTKRHNYKYQTKVYICTHYSQFHQYYHHSHLHHHTGMTCQYILHCYIGNNQQNKLLGRRLSNIIIYWSMIMMQNDHAESLRAFRDMLYLMGTHAYNCTTLIDIIAKNMINPAQLRFQRCFNCWERYQHYNGTQNHLIIYFSPTTLNGGKAEMFC